MTGLETARRLIAEEREKKSGYLDLGNLGLTELPPEVRELVHLRSLNLGSHYPDSPFRPSGYGDDRTPNELSGLPSSLPTLRYLRELSVRENPVTDLTPLAALTSLQLLDCSHTQVSDLTPVATLTSLRSLTCSRTQVSDLASLAPLVSLQSLTCSRTLVSNLTPLATLRSLRSLDCLDTPVCDLTPLACLTSLQSLTCSDTLVSDLTPLTALTALRSLECSHTEVSDLAPLTALTALQALYFSNTDVSDLTPLTALTALQTLFCSGTQVSDLTPLAALTALQGLSCSGTQVSDLTPLAALAALHSVHCSGTKVSDLTPLTPLTSLRWLSCSHTQVSDLTPLATLRSLQSLDCSNTQVSDLTPLAAFTSLQWLDCSGTRVHDLTPLSTLTSLQSLECRNTQVCDLEPLAALTSLQSLDCSVTQVSDLSPLIVLPSLSRLTANRCQLSDVPVRLVQSRALKELLLFQTAVASIPPEVSSADAYSNCLDDLRSHLADMEAGGEKLDEAKLVVLGNGRVGKTQICRRLRGLSYDETVQSTHGITVTADRWAGSSDGGVLNIWDFGGQDIYHGAHTLFMKTRAIFLIVWHPDFETAVEQSADGMLFRNYPLAYWLEYVRTLGSRDCPVIVAQARCDRPEKEVRQLPVDDGYLKFSYLKPCWYSAKTNRGRGALDDALTDAIEFVREREGIATIGAGRMRVLRQLEAWRNEDQARPREARLHRTLSHAEFRELCLKGNDVRSTNSLLAYLHNLGVVFYQPSLFQERVILDQSWALEAVYGVFDRHKAYPLIVSQGGKFSPSLLAMTAWREYSEAEQRLFLSLMESCGVAFLHRQAEPRFDLQPEYIAPDMLPGKDALAAQLDGRWNDRDETWRLEFEYPFLHPGLMRAFICEVGRHSQDAGVYWKYGAWVYEKSSGCRASVDQLMTDDRKGRITITLQGPHHEELASWLRERIEKCNRLFGYADLKPVVDELGPAREPRNQTPYRDVADDTGLEIGSSAKQRVRTGDTAEPHFSRPPASFFPPRTPEIFVSYSWGEDTIEGRQRRRLVDDLCATFRLKGLTVHRDRDDMRPGDLIGEFMDRLSEGDFIIAVISDKYLKSEYCMYELFRVYRNCADKPDRFVRKVLPLILPDAELSSPTGRLRRAIYWQQEEEKQEPLVQQHVQVVGTQFFRKFKLIGEFARNTSDMLEYLVDKLQPRDFERQAAEGFRELLSQVTETR